MNTPRQFCLGLLLGILIAASQPILLAAAASTNTPSVASTNTAPAIVNTNDFISTFESKGRDPFFPNSARLAPAPGESGETQPAVILVVKGFSGSAARRFAIINDRTFTAGEEGEVVTAVGRIRIRCVEIRDNLAVVTMGNNGPKIELRLPQHQ